MIVCIMLACLSVVYSIPADLFSRYNADDDVVQAAYVIFVCCDYLLSRSIRNAVVDLACHMAFVCSGERLSLTCGRDHFRCLFSFEVRVASARGRRVVRFVRLFLWKLNSMFLERSQTRFMMRPVPLP